MPKTLVRTTRPKKENTEPILSSYRLENRKPTLNKKVQGTNKKKTLKEQVRILTLPPFPPHHLSWDLDFSNSVTMETMALLKIMPRKPFSS